MTRFCLVNPAAMLPIRKANGWIPGTEVAANLIMSGTVGMIHGCQVVVSNKLIANKALTSLSPGALGYLQQETSLLRDRDISTRVQS